MDAEKLLAKYLRAHPALEAIPDVRVVASPPDETIDPWVMVNEQDAPQAPGDPSDTLVAHYFQIDCYAGEGDQLGDGGGIPEANALGDAVRTAIVEIDRHDHDEGVVTSGRIEGSRRLPDVEGFEPARQRRIVTATIHARAK